MNSGNQTDPMGNLNIQVVKFTTCPVVFMLLRLFNGQFHIIYLSTLNPVGHMSGSFHNAFKGVYLVLWVMNYFQHYSLFTTDKTQHIILSYFYGKYSYELQSLIPSVQSFTAKTHLATNTESDRPNSLRIPLVRSTFYSDSFFLGTNIWRKKLLLPRSLRSSSIRSTVIYLTCLHNLHLFPTLTFIQQLHSLALYIRCLFSLVCGEQFFN